MSRDLSERRRAERQQRLLAEASAAEQQQRLLSEVSACLVSSLDHEAALTAVAHRVVPLLADSCLIHLQEEGVFRLIASVHAPGSAAERLGADASIAEAPWPPAELERVYRTGRSRLIPDTRRLLGRTGNGAAHRFRLLQGFRPASLMAVPLTARGRTLGTLTLLREAAGPPYAHKDLVLAEELALRTAYAVDNARLYQEAQEAISLRDEFLTVASHELRTPITTLHLQLQNLRRLSERRGDPALGRKLALSAKQTQRLGRLIDGLLDVSRISTGRVPFTLETLDLSRLAGEVVEQCQAEAASAHCELVLQAGGPVVGQYDKLRMEQVLANLLSNAIKYAAGKPVVVSVEARGDLARLTVQDQGIGIPAEDLGRIFGRFERAVSPRHYGGLGLGLFITRQIVEAHGGSIEVASQPGQGATFTVSLPRRLPEHAAPERPGASR